MRVLYVTAGFPFPLTSGYLRHYHLASALQRQGHDVVLASLDAGRTADANLAAMRSLVSEILVPRLAPAARPVIRRRASRAIELLIGRSASDVRALRAVIEAPTTGDFDVAVISGKRTVGILGALANTPLVVDLCDATSERLAGMASAARGARRWRYELELRRVRAAERTLVARANAVLVASERDKTALEAAGVVARASVLPNGVDADYWSRKDRQLGRDRVVLTGVMSYEPNVDAAMTLISDVMPHVRRRVPHARLTIVGRDPVPALRAKASRSQAIELTGFVDDVRPYLERAAVFAAPLRFGAGIQNKVLEAMAMSVPSVVSSLAAGGLEVEGQKPPVTITDDPAVMAEEIAQRLQLVERDPTPDHAARAFVTSRFTWQRSGERLGEIVAEAGSRP